MTRGTHAPANSILAARARTLRTITFRIPAAPWHTITVPARAVKR